MEVSRWSCLASEERARSLGLIRRGILSVVGPQELKAHACMTPRLCGCPLLDVNTLSNPGLTPHTITYQIRTTKPAAIHVNADVPCPPMSQVPSPPMFHVHLAMKCDILEHIQRVDSNDTVPVQALQGTRSSYVDRDFLEARIEELEEEKATALSATPKHPLRRILEGHSNDRNVAGIVILGEHQGLSNLANVLPVQKEPRMPRENELFVFRCVSKSWSRSRIGTFVTRS